VRSSQQGPSAFERLPTRLQCGGCPRISAETVAIRQFLTACLLVCTHEITCILVHPTVSRGWHSHPTRVPQHGRRGSTSSQPQSSPRSDSLKPLMKPNPRRVLVIMVFASLVVHLSQHAFEWLQAVAKGIMPQVMCP